MIGKVALLQGFSVHFALTLSALFQQSSAHIIYSIRVES
jgi:hypothetical protein